MSTDADLAEAVALLRRIAPISETVQRFLARLDAQDNGVGSSALHTSLADRGPATSADSPDPDCDVCKGRGRVLHVYARGPGDPPGTIEAVAAYRCPRLHLASSLDDEEKKP